MQNSKTPLRIWLAVFSMFMAFNFNLTLAPSPPAGGEEGNEIHLLKKFVHGYTTSSPYPSPIERGDEARLNLSYTFKQVLVLPPKRRALFFHGFAPQRFCGSVLPAIQ